MFRVTDRTREPTTVGEAVPRAPQPRRDRLFDAPRDLVDFTFDESVVDVFPDMIRRSVPGYEAVVGMTGLIAARHLGRGGRCYDLGCSLGASTHSVLHAMGDAPCEIVAVDDSAAMIQRAREIASHETRVRWLEADVRAVDLERADVVILNYTLQFLAPEDRLPLLRRIRGALSPGGILIVSEKLHAPGYAEKVHLDFKRANGYSELEISQKRAALENVMRVDSEDEHLARFGEAGFAAAETWFRCLNWASFVVWPQSP